MRRQCEGQTNGWPVRVQDAAAPVSSVMALPWQAVEWYGSEVPRGIAACGTGAWQHDGKSAKYGIEILMIRYDAEHDPEHDWEEEWMV